MGGTKNNRGNSLKMGGQLENGEGTSLKKKGTV